MTRTPPTRAEWSGVELRWSIDVAVPLRIGATVVDATPPRYSGAGAHTSYVFMDFTENLDTDNLPPASAFRFEADGNPLTFGSLDLLSAVGDLNTTLRFERVSPPILLGQTVTVSYTDPTSGDDAKAIQDVDGNDAASFTAEAANLSHATASRGRPEIAGAAVVGETLTALGEDRQSASLVNAHGYSHRLPTRGPGGARPVRSDERADRDLEPSPGNRPLALSARRRTPAGQHGRWSC